MMKQASPGPTLLGWRPGVEEKLGYYVYVLSDPRKKPETPFYIGKGIGNRCFNHIIEARRTRKAGTENYPKLDTIRAIETAEKRGAKRSVLIEILGLPIAACVDPAHPHDVKVGRELLAERLSTLPAVQAVVADRGYRGLAALAARRHVKLDIKVPPKATVGFTPLAPLYTVEHAFAQLGRWRRLSRCYEGSVSSARTWLEVASVGYLAWRAVA